MNGEQDSGHFAHLNADSVIQEMKTSPRTGLSTKTAMERLTAHGYNRLVEKKDETLGRVLLNQLKEPMILILVVVAAIYALIGSHEDAIIIVVIVSIVITIEVVNLNRSKRSIDALKRLTSPTCMVVRSGKAEEIESYLLVPGDLIILTAGERVPADARLLEAYGLKVDESSLTGESMPVFKDPDDIPTSNVISDFHNMVFSGTLVIQGNGRAVVTSTGKGTEIGKISTYVQEAEEQKSPLSVSMDRLALNLAYIALFFSIFIPLVGYFQGNDFRTMILTGLSLAFAIIPEELPVIISLTLAVGAYALTRKNAIVKDLRAAETLGNVTYIATDKTGTITENTMTVSNVSVHNSNSENDDGVVLKFLKSCILAVGNPPPDVMGANKLRDPMERAVYRYATSNGVNAGEVREEYRLVEQFSFDNAIRMASYVYRKGKDHFIYVSGAPEVVLENSTEVLENGAVREIRQSDIDAGTREIEQISEKGERIIAVAFRKVNGKFQDRSILEKDLTFLGLVSFLDPPRKGVEDAIRDCSNAGIRVIMLTGDYANTARTIAGRVGIDTSEGVITGEMMSQMDDDELLNSLKSSSVFARITSGDKLRIVNLLSGRGDIIAVTGDGVNDAPALQSAQIGIAMGQRGTDVAKESSDVILMDDNFNTIVEAVRVGRQIFHTLRKGVAYYMTVQFALVAIFLVPLALSIPFPFSPIQIIVLEIFMDIGALWGFLSEPPEKGLMKERPRDPRKKFLDRSLVYTITGGSAGLVLAVSILYLYSYYSIGNVVEAQTTAFITWVFSQVFLAMNFRTEKEPISRRGFLSNRPILIWGIAVVLLLAAISVIPDLQVFVHTGMLTYADWAFIVIASFMSSTWMEGVKIFRSFRRRKSPHGIE